MAYTLAQLETMLSEVQAAISKCLTSQEYTAGAGMGLKRPVLEQLQAREKWLLAEQERVTALASRYGKNLARFPRPQ